MKLKILSFFILITTISKAQLFYAGPFAHTFSIVARDTTTGEMGVAVQSHWFSVGSVVSWGEAGVGVVATQSFVNESFGVRGLELLKEGKSPEEVVKILIDSDSAKDVRQLAVLDSKGRVAAFTGKNCIEAAGHITGSNFSCEANLMLNDKVWPAMAKTFKESKGPLAERMVEALNAGQEAGGDIRGKQSAAILIVNAKSTGKIWEDRALDLRVEDNPEPIKELKRLLKIHRAYEHMNNGDIAVEKNDVSGALSHYAEAEKMFPANMEMKFWTAVTMVNKGKMEEALPLFKTVFKKEPNWKILFPRLVKAGMITTSDENLKKISDL